MLERNPGCLNSVEVLDISAYCDVTKGGFLPVTLLFLVIHFLKLKASKRSKVSFFSAVVEKIKMLKQKCRVMSNLMGKKGLEHQDTDRVQATSVCEW